MNSTYEQLTARLGRVRDLEMAAAVMGWDQEVAMPPGGVQTRADQLTTLQSLMHQYLVDEEMGALLEALRSYEAELDPDSDEASIIRVNRRDYEQEVRVPTDLVEELAQVTAQAQAIWAQARQESNFKLFEPILTRVMDLQRRLAGCFPEYANPYDALLDRFDPGVTYEYIAGVFDGLKPGLVQLVAEITAHRDRVDASLLKFPVDEAIQMQLTREVTTQIGYDYTRGRVDKSTHPFSTHFSTGDVRITTRFDPENIASSLMSSVHEAGHAMYEQNVSPALYRTRLDSGASTAVHESQSRFYENIVGRGRAFWSYWYPRLQAMVAPKLDAVDLEAFYRALNRVEPSLIRVEADEVTYGLHIMLRFELENDLINERVKVADLPEIWNARMQEYLGITPPNDRLGVLQDIHWAFGLVGYFPDYLLGSILAVQLWERMQRDLPDVEAQIARGEFGAILGWQRTHIHQHGRKFTLPEITLRATGETLRWEPYLSYLRAKYSEIYGL